MRRDYLSEFVPVCSAESAGIRSRSGHTTGIAEAEGEFEWDMGSSCEDVEHHAGRDRDGIVLDRIVVIKG